MVSPLAYLTPSRRLGFPAEQEGRFRDDFIEESIHPLRIAAVLGAVLYAAFGALNPWIIPTMAVKVWFIQYAVVCPLLLITWIATFVPFIQAHQTRLVPLGVALDVLVAGAGIVLLTAISSTDNISALAYSGVLVLVVMASYTVARMLYVWALCVNLILFIGYLIAATGFQQALGSQLGVVVFYCNVSILIGANLLGLVACYNFEYYARLDFMQRRKIRAEQETSDRLLLNILPKEVAAKLKKSSEPIAQDYPEATLIFADICNFTPLSSSMTPLALLQLLNEVFTAFDEIVSRHGAEKIKTIGDCYMITVGVPTPVHGHARTAARIALEMREYLMNREEKTSAGEPLAMRIGIHTGPVVAGVIGRSKFIYDLWGDTVNIASRMESHSLPGRIQITRDTYERIKNAFDCEYRGHVEVKGKGDMETWFVNGPKQQEPGR